MKIERKKRERKKENCKPTHTLQIKRKIWMSIDKDSIKRRNDEDTREEEEERRAKKEMYLRVRIQA